VRVFELLVGCLLDVCNEYIDYHKIKFMIIRKKIFSFVKDLQKKRYIYFVFLIFSEWL